MINRSPAANFARSVFFEKNNDFDIYIEDTAEGYEKIFSILFSRASEKKVNIERVFSLGSRVDVVAAANKIISEGSNRKSVFVVDGDIFLLCGEQYDIPDNVVRLPRYCIENFLTDADALHEVLDEEESRLDIEALKGEFQLNEWIEESTPLLKELFLSFSLCQKLEMGLKTVSLGSRSICLDDFGKISKEKIEKIINGIDAEILKKFSLKEKEEALLEIESKIDFHKCFISSYVSAKDFTLPLMLIRLRNLTSSKSSNLSIKMRLAKKCDIEPFKVVADEIISVANIQ